MARLTDYDTSNPLKATIVESTRITAADSEVEVRELVLQVDKKDFNYQVGQNIGVIVSGPHEMGHNEHFRLYTIADIFETNKSKMPLIKICVRRCSYIDDYSGERYDGIASNYLCDLKSGATITITGPYGLAFDIPEDKTSDLLMIGLGTGIAPFRALVKHIYKNVGGWEGKVRLFFGARSGLELLYMNDEKDDFTLYYDEETFEAFQAVSPRPHWDDPIALDYALEERAEEVWNMVMDPKTHVFVAGIDKVGEMLDNAFEKMAGSKDKWQLRKAELVAGKRWKEVIY